MPALSAVRFTPLHKALLASLTLHLVLLAWSLQPRHAAPAHWHDSGLRIVLVNRSSAHAPRQPQVLAQRDLDAGGGGSGLATSPLAAADSSRNGNASADLERQVRARQHQQHQLLASLHTELALLRRLQTHSSDPQRRLELQQQRRILLQQLGAIERQLHAADAAARRRWLGPSARGTAFALYDDRMRRRIEGEGTRHFPQRDGRKLYGQLVMQIVVDASGRLLQTEVLRSSGQPLLDRLACATVARAQPFGRFDARMRAQADQLALVAGFDFSRDDGLHTQLHNPR